MSDWHSRVSCALTMRFSAVKFSPAGGLIRVALEVSRFEANPLAVVASDQLLAYANGDREPLPSRSAQPHASWLQSPMQSPIQPSSVEMVNMDEQAADGAVRARGASRPMPLIPELLGTVLVRVSVKDTGQQYDD
jgi:hypothetical protein